MENTFRNRESDDSAMDLSLSRRDFLKAAGGGIIVLFSVGVFPVPPGDLLAQAPPADFNGYLRIGADGAVVAQDAVPPEAGTALGLAESADLPAVLGAVHLAGPSAWAAARGTNPLLFAATVLLTGLLDAPVNPVFGTGMAERQTLFLTNMGLYGIMVPIPGWTWPGPSLVKIEVDKPGVPVP